MFRLSIKWITDHEKWQLFGHPTIGVVQIQCCGRSYSQAVESLEKLRNIMQLIFHPRDYVWDKKANALPQKMTKTAQTGDSEGNLADLYFGLRIQILPKGKQWNF